MFAVTSQGVFTAAAAAGNCKTQIFKLYGGFLALITQHQAYHPSSFSIEKPDANALFA
jgi:hypothetical protein